MAPKLGTFAKRFAKKRPVVMAVAETEAQRRARTNKVPTKREALLFAEKVAKGVARYPSTRPLMIAIVPRVEVRQPVPYKASTYKK